MHGISHASVRSAGLGGRANEGVSSVPSVKWTETPPPPLQHFRNDCRGRRASAASLNASDLHAFSERLRSQSPVKRSTAMQATTVPPSLLYGAAHIAPAVAPGARSPPRPALAVPSRGSVSVRASMTAGPLQTSMGSILATPACTPATTPRSLQLARSPSAGSLQVAPTQVAAVAPMRVVSFSTLVTSPHPPSRATIARQLPKQQPLQVAPSLLPNTRQQRLFAPPPRASLTPKQPECAEVLSVGDPNWRESGTEMTAERHELMDEVNL